MTVELVVPDTMGDLRAGLRSLTDLNDYLRGTGESVNRAFFSTPAGAKFPLLRLTEAGTSISDETPLVTQRALIEVIGGAPSDYYKVSQAKRVIVSWIWGLRGLLGSTTWVEDGAVDTVTDRPDPDDGAPAKVISAVLLVRAL